MHLAFIYQAIVGHVDVHDFSNTYILMMFIDKCTREIAKALQIEKHAQVWASHLSLELSVLF